MLNKILDNRFIQIAILPIAIWNTFSSYRKTRKEWNLFKDTINSNDQFFKSLATLGFTPKTFMLETIKEIGEFQTEDEVKEIANRTIINIIMSYVKDEQLLGIISLICVMLNRHEVKVSIIPSTYAIYLNDRYDLKISLIIWSIITIILLITMTIF